MKSRGSVVLLLLMLLLSVTAVGVALWPLEQAPLRHQLAVGERLAQARTGLIEYATTYPQNYTDTSSGPGRFPCPDSNGNGDPGPRCPGLAMGFLPLGFASSTGVEQDLFQDESVASEPIWWVVAGPYRNRPAPSGSPTHAMLLNTATPSTMSLDGVSDVIGLLIAPGPALPGQQRTGTVQVSDYLEGDNADGDSAFSRSAGNDRVLAIRWQHVMPLVERQALGAVQRALVQYAADEGRMPWLADISALDAFGDMGCTTGAVSGWVASTRYRAGVATALTETCVSMDGTVETQSPLEMPGWLTRNFWHSRIWAHVRNRDFSSGPSLDGQPADAVLVGVGPPLSPAPSGINQSNTGTALSNYLDHVENSQATSDYVAFPDGNDQWLTVQGALP